MQVFDRVNALFFCLYAAAIGSSPGSPRAISRPKELLRAKPMRWLQCTCLLEAVIAFRLSRPR